METSKKPTRKRKVNDSESDTGTGKKKIKTVEKKIPNNMGGTKSKSSKSVNLDKAEVTSNFKKAQTMNTGGVENKTTNTVSRKANLDKNEVTSTSKEAQFVSDNRVQIWDEVDVLALTLKISKKLVQNFVSLLSEGCTLPFIARYRKSSVDYLPPDKLQDMFECYQNVTQLKKKVKSVIETLDKSKKLTPEVEKSILSARTLPELDFVYAPLKSHSLSLAERAKKLGLEPHAIRILNGENINLWTLCTNEDELSTIEKVESHITHIIADIIHKDTRILEHMRSLKEETRFTIQSSRTKSSMKEKEDNTNKKYESKSDPETYKLYFEWKCPSQFIKAHQTLALNRGEDEKILTVKVNVPDWFYNRLERYALTLWKNSDWVRKGLGDAYNRLIKPWLSRQVRADLTNAANKEAVKTFTTNLEKYLLTEPIKNRNIAGLDPGFRAGCKVGIINSNGDMLDVCTLHPDLRRVKQHDPAARQLKDLLSKHRVELIGLGNGTACRETELWLKHHSFDNVPVIIVPEQGASIYSVSKEAQNEHPNMDPNLISALSIARRVLDPLGELIKVDAKNLGVGLYQHDIPPKMLESALECTIEKVVSLVGVDINTASFAMLRRISGLNEGRAKKILAYRQEHNGFKTRSEILSVSGIGKVTFQQCAGFLKVLGGPEPLDSTIIHPESYAIAKSFAKKLNLNIRELSQPHFAREVERTMSFINLECMSQELGTDVANLELIINAFKQKSFEDNIITFCKPVYSNAVQATDQIREGMTLTGVVRNVVPFGCFVDCGVGDNGLIHRSKLNGNQTPKLGDRVSVTVIGSPKPKKIQLKLERILD